MNRLRSGICLSLLGMGLLGLVGVGVWAEEPSQPVQAPPPLEAILAGNARFAENRAMHPHQSHQRLVALARGQHPTVAVLACSDSRIAPELILDQGLGDIFDVRVAGNIADDAVLGSLEYAVDHLHVPLILVLGHEDCGAVKATLAHEHPHNHVNAIIHALAPAVRHANGSVETAVKQNVQAVVDQLKHDPALKKSISEGRLHVVGGYYHLETGRIELLQPTDATGSAGSAAEASSA